MIKLKVDQKPKLDNTRSLNKDKLLSMLKRMLAIRYAEEQIALGITNKQIMTPCHLYIGQEAAAVGVCNALRDTDYVFSTHRSHGHFLAKGGNLKELFAEIYCRETGCSGGRGGSMHLCDPGKGLLGSSSIVAGGLGIGIGPALKSKIMGLDTVSVIFHGDCVPEEGIWHESLNFSTINNLPVIYVCENNLYAASAALEDRRKFDNIAAVAREHGLDTKIVDGNDIFAVYDAAMTAVENARNNQGPQFIECRTYRWLGHVGPSDNIADGLRTQEELDFWKARCPIQSLSEWLVANDMITEAELKTIEDETFKKVADAEQYALGCNKPNPDTLYDNVYKDGVEV